MVEVQGCVSGAFKTGILTILWFVLGLNLGFRVEGGDGHIMVPTKFAGHVVTSRQGMHEPGCSARMFGTALIRSACMALQGRP